MKIFITTTLALGALCVLEMNQAAKAALRNDPNFHLTRGGGGHGGGHGFEGHREEGPGEEGRGEGYGAGAAGNVGEGHPIANDHPVAEDRVHTLNNDVRNNEEANRWNDEGWEGVGGIGGCLQTDANGVCIEPQ